MDVKQIATAALIGFSVFGLAGCQSSNADSSTQAESGGHNSCNANSCKQRAGCK